MKTMITTVALVRESYIGTDELKMTIVDNVTQSTENAYIAKLQRDEFMK